MYKIIRFYTRDSGDTVTRRTIKKGLSYEEARAHCNDPETSATTATGPRAHYYKKRGLLFFDGYEET